MGASGDIMFGPWAAYFPVSLGLGCNIDPVSLGLGYDIVTMDWHCESNSISIARFTRHPSVRD